MSRIIRVDNEFERRLRAMQRKLAMETGRRYTLVEVTRMVMKNIKVKV